MTKQSFFRSMNRGCLLLSAVLAMTFSGLGQDYTIEEYNEYQDALADGPDALITWAKANPESALLEYVKPTFIGWAKEHAEKGEYQQAIEVGEKYMAELDGDVFELLYLTTWSAYSAGQFDKAAEYGERVYQQKPETPEILTILANSFLKLSDTAKTIEYGEKYCAEADPKDCYGFFPVIARHYFEEKDYAKADAYAKKVLEAFEAVDQPAAVPAEQWNEYVTEEKSVAYAIIGRAAYERNAWKAAQSAYQKVLETTPRANKGRRTEAYYYIGMANWKQEQIRPAMEIFSKGSQIEGGEMAKYCRQQLEHLYKATHNGSLAGLDEFMEKHRP